MQDDEPIIRMPGDGPKHRTPFGDMLVWKAGEGDTDGHFSVHERTAPPGARSTPHRHHELVEAFYMLEGECEFIIGDRTLRGGADTFVLAPKATLHGWALVGEAPVKMLCSSRLRRRWRSSRSSRRCSTAARTPPRCGRSPNGSTGRSRTHHHEEGHAAACPYLCTVTDHQ